MTQATDPTPMSKEMEAHWSVGFESRLSTIINTLGIDAKTETPDYLLARMLTDCLLSYDRLRTKRDTLHPSAPPPKEGGQ